LRNKKLLWLFGSLVLVAVLFMLVGSRRSHRMEVIFGGSEGSFVRTDNVEKVERKTEDESEEDALDWPDIDTSLNQYYMVNDKNLLSSAYEAINSTRVPGTNMMMVAGECLPYLTAMLDDLVEHGFKYYIGGAYRSYSFQTILFNGKASQIAAGLGVYDYMDPLYQEAVAEARTITMFPGASEHQTGLALDLFDKNYSYLKYENMNQDFFEYLDSICANYGFIKRYPTKKLLLTGWDEPWHYRFVGVEAATFIMENGLCYEEFWAHYNPGFTY